MTVSYFTGLPLIRKIRMGDEMQQLIGNVVKFLFIVFAVAIIGWTGMHTYDVLYNTNPVQGQQILAIYGLLVFEAGTIIWYGLFLRGADGLGQHSIAIIGAVVGVGLISAAFVLDYTVPKEELIGYNSMARWAVVIATIVNLLLVFCYELFSPPVWEHLQEQLHVAMLMQKAGKKAEKLIDQGADELAEAIARNAKERAFAQAKLQGIKEVPEAGPGHPINAPSREKEAVTVSRNGSGDSSKNS